MVTRLSLMLRHTYFTCFLVTSMSIFKFKELDSESCLNYAGTILCCW